MPDPHQAPRSFKLALIVAGVLLALAAVGWGPAPHTAQASPAQDLLLQGPLPPDPRADTINAECLACHELPDMVRTLPSGEQQLLTVDVEVFETSGHSREGYACTQCHTNITEFPHTLSTSTSLRDFALDVNQVCADCHTAHAAAYAIGRHAQEFVKGNQDTALCVDCHSAHHPKQLDQSAVDIVQTCRNCHLEIYEIYENSVHGAALLEGNPDVPACNDCHDDHANTGPGDPGYVLFSPQICAECHADVELMSEYDINTNVFDTYVADFHGSTIIIFEKTAPDQETNKPVCSDCHGVHNILPPTDANSSVMQENITATCQRCHPEADLEFSDSWLNHYTPDLEHNAMVFVVDVFYRIMIPGTIGGMLIFIGADVWKRTRNGNGNGGRGAKKTSKKGADGNE